jgi:hypothetical protein
MDHNSRHQAQSEIVEIDKIIGRLDFKRADHIHAQEKAEKKKNPTIGHIGF